MNELNVSAKSLLFGYLECVAENQGLGHERGDGYAQSYPHQITRLVHLSYRRWIGRTRVASVESLAIVAIPAQDRYVRKPLRHGCPIRTPTIGVLDAHPNLLQSTRPGMAHPQELKLNA